LGILLSLLLVGALSAGEINLGQKLERLAREFGGIDGAVSPKLPVCRPGQGQEEVQAKKNIDDSLKNYSGFKRRTPLDISMAPYDTDNNDPNVAVMEDVLGWMADAASFNKLLFMDLKFGSCLGCMNAGYGMAINDIRENKDVLSGLVDLQDQSEMQHDDGLATEREPYEKIEKTEAYKFMQALTSGKRQLYNENTLVESFPLVPPDQRDGSLHAVREDQQKRKFTRPHFPNLMFIDGKKINKEKLNRLCGMVKKKQKIEFEEGEDGIFKAKSDDIGGLISDILGEGAMLMQLLNFNLYRTGSETAEDLLFDDLNASVDCIQKAYNKKEGSKKCYLYNRFTSENPPRTLEKGNSLRSLGPLGLEEFSGN